MGYLYAKIKARGNENKIRKMIQTDSSIYPRLVEVVKETVPYSQETNIEEGVWYCLKDFSKTSYSLDILTANISSSDFDDLKDEELGHLDYIFYLSEDHNEIYFQNLGKAALVSQKRFLILKNGYKYEPECKSIAIKEFPDAIYNKMDDCLFFRNLSYITGIFPGIGALYREATNEETEQFLNMDFITKDGITVEVVKTPNRKRIALAMETLKHLNKKQKKEIYGYIAEYCPGLSDGKSKFTVSSNEDLALVLYGIEQRFYTTPVGEEKRIANSVIKL